VNAALAPKEDCEEETFQFQRNEGKLEYVAGSTLDDVE
jgi:hypothetical protein